MVDTMMIWPNFAMGWLSQVALVACMAGSCWAAGGAAGLGILAAGVANGGDGSDGGGGRDGGG